MKKLRIHTLGNNNIFKYSVANYLGVNPEIGRVVLCRMLKDKNITIIVGNIFEGWASYVGEKETFIEKRAFDLGLYYLRMLIKHNVTVIFEDTQSIKADLSIINRISPPLWDKCNKLIKASNP